MRNKSLRNSSMVANVVVKIAKKSLVRYEIGGKAKQEVKKLINRVEIGGHSRQYYGGRFKEAVV
jgi:hypothetical protein